MPTTQPLDDELDGDIAEGPMKPIAGFAREGNRTIGQQPRAAVPERTAAGVSRPAGETGVPTVPRVPTPPSPAGRDTPGAGGNKIRFHGIRTPNANLSGIKNQNGSRPGDNSPKNDRVPEPVAPNQPSGSAAEPGTYDDAQVVSAWNAFIDAHKSEHLLTNAMRMVTPTRIGDGVYRLAQSPVHIGYIGENLVRITEYMQKSIGSNALQFVLESVTEDSPLAWTDRQLLEHIIEKKPAVKDFVTTLGLSFM